MIRQVRSLAAVVIVVVAITGRAFAWSGGPVFDVSDLEPKCATCHSSVNKEQLRTEPTGVANFLFVENLHYKAIEEGKGPYQAIPPADRQKLLADVKTLDENASVTISVPGTLRPGQEVQVTVNVRGGNEIVGVALVDTDLRRKARIIPAPPVHPAPAQTLRRSASRTRTSR